MDVSKNDSRRVLVVHHTASPTLHTLVDAVVDGAATDQVIGVEVERSPALVTTASVVLEADGYILVTPANFGYMSGALKHFFDTIFYPCLAATTGRPFGLVVHGNDDTGGAVRAVDKIVGGLGWKQVTDHVELTAAPTADDTDRCWNLGATVAASTLE